MRGRKGKSKFETVIRNYQRNNATDELMGISQGVAENLSSLHNIRRTVRLQRPAHEENLPSLPASRDIIPILPAMYQTNSADEQFLLFDSDVGDAQRIFIFVLLKLSNS